MAKNNVAAAILASAPKNQATMAALIQQQSQQFDVNRPYTPLPRPAEAFTNGTFAPLLPIPAAPVNESREDSERPDPRRFEYPVGWNLPMLPGTEGLKLVPFSRLRQMADAYSVARSCVDHRVNEIVSMGWDIVPTLEQTQKMKGDPDLREDWEKRRRQVLDFFKTPDSDKAKYPTFEAWLSALLEDRFVIDAQAIHLRPPRRKGSGPFGSNLAALDLLDGSTIRPMLDVYGATPMGNVVAYQQYIYGVPRVDLTTVFTEQDLDVLGDPDATFTSDQLIYMRDTPRVWTPYGFSCVEKAIQPIFIGWLRQQYQLDYFTDGSVPAQFVTPGPEISTPQQIRQLQDALNAMAGDIGAKHRIIVLPPGSNAREQKGAPLADQFDEFIISQVSMPFEMTPMDLGVTPRVSAVQSPAETKQISEINTNKGSSTRIKPVLNQLKADLFDYVIQRIFKQDDMEWFWGDPTEDEAGAEVVDNHVNLVSNGLETIDEARIATGKNPYGLPETSVPGIKTATGYMPLTVAVQAAVASVAGAAGAPGAAGAAPLAGKPGQPKPPAQPDPNAAQKPAQQPVKMPVLTTPAHDAIRAATGTPPAAKSITAELQILKRYLSNGKPLEKFETKVLSPEAMAAATAELPKGVTGAVLAAAHVMSAQMHRSRRTAHLNDAIGYVVDSLNQLVAGFRNGTIGAMTFVDSATAAIAAGYRRAMSAGSEDASADFEDTPVVPFDREVAERANRQQGFIQKLMHSANITDDDMDRRVDQYGQSMVGSYNSAYGQTMKGSHPDYEIVWELGDAEHCDECLARAGKSFTFATLPGWPGDGDFGGPLCKGGPLCACSLSFRQNGKEVDRGENTQRADGLSYYPSQQQAIADRRQQQEQERDAFIDSLPGDRTDMSTVQGRAFLRDSLRAEVARLANAYIQSAGGYQGVTFEPSDVPAAIVVQLMPPDARNPVYRDLPQIDFDEAVRQFVGKVGPKGYIHGWIFVGIPLPGAHVFHPHLGHGTVVARHGNRVHVHFERNDAHHEFEVGEPEHAHGKVGFFKPREAHDTDEKPLPRSVAPESEAKPKEPEPETEPARTHTFENTRHMTDDELGDLLAHYYATDPAKANEIEDIINEREARGIPKTEGRFADYSHGPIDSNPETNPAVRPERNLTPKEAAKEQYDQYTMAQYQRALDDTNGVLLNKAGQEYARSTGPRDLEYQIFHGPWQVANKYASEELQQWWRENGRETMQSFRYGMYQWDADRAAAENVKLRGHSRNAQGSLSDRSQQ
jgi:hypothetical protein